MPFECSLSKTPSLHEHCTRNTLFCTFLFHHYMPTMWKMPSFTCCWRTLTGDEQICFVFLNFGMVFRNSSRPGEFAYVWQSGEHWNKASSVFKRHFRLPRILRSILTLWYSNCWVILMLSALQQVLNRSFWGVYISLIWNGFGAWKWRGLQDSSEVKYLNLVRWKVSGPSQDCRTVGNSIWKRVRVAKRWSRGISIPTGIISNV